MNPSFTGCHGVRIEPADLATPYGTTQGEPRASVRLADSISTPVNGEKIWDGGASHEMSRLDDRSLLLRISGRPALWVDQEKGEAATGDVPRAAQLQLVSTFALPLIAQGDGALVLHASVVVRNDRAVVVCAESGTGKSSMLVALAGAGWAPLTEDLVALDLGAPARGGAPAGVVAWPGPPWVRIAPGEPGPSGAHECFRSVDKVGWALGADRCDRAVAVSRIVLLDPPARQPASPTEAAPEDVIATLATHAPWFEEPEGRARALFGPLVRLARSVPATRLRLRRSSSWRDEAIEVFDQLGV